MGLMLARVGASFDSGTARTATATIVGGGAATGIVMAGQYAYGDDFSPQSKPTAMNHVVGASGGAIGAVLGICGAVGAGEGSALGRKFAFGGLGMTIGSIAGAYLVAPTLRRMQAED